MMGSIPASVNLPLSSLEKAFTMDSSDFMKAYGFRKPDKKMPLIFFCKAGVRSSSAVSLAKGKGYTNARNYPGSYADVSLSYWSLACRS
jgi:rhodanese-related sulfurtransferase